MDECYVRNAVKSFGSTVESRLQSVMDISREKMDKIESLGKEKKILIRIVENVLHQQMKIYIKFHESSCKV